MGWRQPLIRPPGPRVVSSSHNQHPARTAATLTMNDLIFIALSAVFFVLSALYVVFCEKVR